MSATLRDLYGTDAPPLPARILTAGRLTARLEGGNLRYVRFEGAEILRAIAFVVRDRDWGTVAPEITDLVVDEGPGAFSVGYAAACAHGGAVLRIRARIEGRDDGSLHFEAEAVAEGDFETNRSGFVLLHAADAAGLPATIEHCDGSRVETEFPRLIDPWCPFVSIRAITHRVGGRFDVTCRLVGEAFEMEDQRNWSDASFKTYGRPLALPWPFTLRTGERIAQSVSVGVRTLPGRAQAEAPPADALAGARMPEIGLVVTPAEVEAAIRHRDLLAGIGPQRILCAYDPTVDDGPRSMAAFAALQAAYPAAYDLECVVLADGDLDAELGGVAEAVRSAGLLLASVAVCPAVDRQSTPPGSAWPDCPPLADIYGAARRAFPGAALGGGMVTNFTELNRKRPPVALLDFVTHSTNPIVHAADDDSVLETLEALPHITRSARAIIGAKPYRIGPSTIAMRHNPYGSRTMDNPDGGRICMANDDPRQRGRFAAAWTAGFAAAIAPADIAVWVPAAFTGPRGLVGAETGQVWPVAGTVADLCRMAGAELESVTRTDGKVVLAAGGQTLIANLSAEIRPVGNQDPLQPFEVRRVEGNLTNGVDR